MKVGPSPPVVTVSTSVRLPSWSTINDCRLPTGEISLTALSFVLAISFLAGTFLAYYSMLKFWGWDAIQEGLLPVGFCFRRVSVLSSESSKYVAIKVEKPPARIVKLTMMP